MGFSDDCLELFGTKDIYQVFHIRKVAKNAEVKKAYYKQSILWHPDRFSSSTDGEAKKLATRKFQVVSKIYNVLSDSERRKVYDTTGSTDDDDFSSVNWTKVWCRMFKKVTPEDIENYLKEFRGSKKEMEDVKLAYVKFKGNLDKIFATVIGADVENEDRIREIIRYYIELGEVEDYPKFSNEPPSKRAKRLDKAKREALEAKVALKEIQEKEGVSDLVALIQNRQNKYSNFVSNLEEKYNSKKKKDKKKIIKKKKLNEQESSSVNRKRKADENTNKNEDKDNEVSESIVADEEVSSSVAQKLSTSNAKKSKRRKKSLKK